MALIAAGTIPPIEDLAPIENNGFWPEIDPALMRAAHRLDGTVTPARLYEALLTAVFEHNAILIAWQLAQIEAGYETAADVPLAPGQIEGQIEQLYRQAVYAAAHAWLVERYRDITATGRATPANETAGTEEVDSYRTAARHAVSEILGESHMTVELI